jgi:sulfopyruvate decarboxylase TPP-binding subunit
METKEKVLQALEQRVKELAMNMEKMKLAEYVDLLENPVRLLYINFISGIARGLGIAVGFAILGAIIVLILQKLVALNLPVIGNFIADLVKIVQLQLGEQ